MQIQGPRDHWVWEWKRTLDFFTKRIIDAEIGGNEQEANRLRALLQDLAEDRQKGWGND